MYHINLMFYKQNRYSQNRLQLKTPRSKGAAPTEEKAVQVQTKKQYRPGNPSNLRLKKNFSTKTAARTESG